MVMARRRQRYACTVLTLLNCSSLQLVLLDVLASNGVVHGINRVLFPPAKFDKSMYLNTTIDPALASALAANIPAALPMPASGSSAPSGSKPHSSSHHSSSEMEEEQPEVSKSSGGN